MEVIALNKARSLIIDDVIPTYIIQYLVKNEVLNDEETNKIMNPQFGPSDLHFNDMKAQQIRRNQVIRCQTEELLNIISTKGSMGFYHFVNALANDDCYPWIADVLKNIYLQRQKKKKSSSCSCPANRLSNNCALC